MRAELSVCLGEAGGAYVTQYRDDRFRPAILFAGTLEQALDFVRDALSSASQTKPEVAR